MDILVLGATGLIGMEVSNTLSHKGFNVQGLARNVERARRKNAHIDWKSCDLADLQNAEAWKPYLRDSLAIVNCVGILQDSAGERVETVQRDAMLALYAAAQQFRAIRIVQVSARTTMADVPFLQTKADADHALKTSGLAHVILRPSLVVGRNAFGGSALLRALAAFPFITPLAYANSPVQTVAIEALVHEIVDAVRGETPSGTDRELGSDCVQSLTEVVASHRAWLGLSPARSLALPSFAANLTSKLADIAAKFGWRSPMRSTSMALMRNGITLSQPDRRERLDMRSVFALHPSGTQDLWFARLYLLKPLLILGLSLFWLLSGIIPLFEPSRAAIHIASWLGSIALPLTVLFCFWDITLGIAVLFRRHARLALLGMLATSIAYLAGATFFAPALWLDPLGPLVKVVPAMLLTLVALAILEER